MHAAGAFFKALKVYPAPLELVMIYQKAVPKEVFDLIMKVVARDAAMNAAGNTSGSAELDGVDDEAPKKPTTGNAQPKEESKPEPKEEPKTEAQPEAPQETEAKSQGEEDKTPAKEDTSA